MSNIAIARFIHNQVCASRGCYDGRTACKRVCDAGILKDRAEKWYGVAPQPLEVWADAYTRIVAALRRKNEMVD